jgi:hypothetical protein
MSEQPGLAPTSAPAPKPTPKPTVPDATPTPTKPKGLLQRIDEEASAFSERFLS